MQSRQLIFDLPHRPAMAREDFLVAPSNQAAVALVDQWPEWPGHAAIIAGPEGSGKSHLASVWQGRSGAVVVGAGDLHADALFDDMATTTMVIEDLDRTDFDEKALFHALNLARERGGHILLTTRSAAIVTAPLLADLRSRLKALPVAAIAKPDDALLRGVLVKLFADRQIMVDESLIGYMVLRMPRSLAAARQIVAEIDAASLAEGAPVTRPFVARIVERHVAPHLFKHED